MLDKFIFTALITVFALSIVIGFPEGLIALALVGVMSVGFLFFFRRSTDQKLTVTRIFLLALALRMLFGIFVHTNSFQDFFAADANTYHFNGSGWFDVWMEGVEPSPRLLYQNMPESGAGWGMNYLVAMIYVITGKSMFAGQSFCAVIGAATATLVFFCSRKIYNNLKVATIAAYSVAIFPSFVIWSSQLMKDGIILFLLVSIMVLTLRLSERFNAFTLALLVFCLFGVMSLRFYIFYMVVVAVVGSFVIGLAKSNTSILFRLLITVALGVGLTYFGPSESMGSQLNMFANLERIQSSRSDLAARANSGFGEDLDVSTTEGAINALPVGFTYLMLAPFPWEAENFRQAITIPEVLIWWAMIPFIILGLIYTVRHRLRKAFPILLFSLLLTIAYSIFQGNVGTAYRQRTQIQVFLYIFVGVGITVYRERKENEHILRAARRRQIDDQLRRRHDNKDSNSTNKE
jgi:hypothetical protein